MPRPRPNRRDIDLLLLLDECLAAERRCDERLKEALALGHGSAITYIRNLKRFYAKRKADLLAEINHRGATEEDILKQLAKLHIDPDFLGRRPKPDDVSC